MISPMYSDLIVLWWAFQMGLYISGITRYYCWIIVILRSAHCSVTEHWFVCQIPARCRLGGSDGGRQSGPRSLWTSWHCPPLAGVTATTTAAGAAASSKRNRDRRRRWWGGGRGGGWWGWEKASGCHAGCVWAWGWSGVSVWRDRRRRRRWWSQQGTCSGAGGREGGGNCGSECLPRLLGCSRFSACSCHLCGPLPHARWATIHPFICFYAFYVGNKNLMTDNSCMIYRKHVFQHYAWTPDIFMNLLQSVHFLFHGCFSLSFKECEWLVAGLLDLPHPPPSRS